MNFEMHVACMLMSPFFLGGGIIYITHLHKQVIFFLWVQI